MSNCTGGLPAALVCGKCSRSASSTLRPSSTSFSTSVVTVTRGALITTMTGRPAALLDPRTRDQLQAALQAARAAEAGARATTAQARRDLARAQEVARQGFLPRAQLEAARTRPVDFFVFAGFCLIYVVASRRVFENVANKLLNQMDQMKREMLQIKQQRAEAPSPALRDEPLLAPESLPALKPEAVKESLSYNDIEILRALAEESYVYGNLVGLTDKTGLARELVSTRLTVLKNLGIIETRINDKNVLHWYVSLRGKQMLGDILSGQDDR